MRCQAQIVDHTVGDGMRLLPSGITQVERSLLGGVIVDKEGLLPIRILKVPQIVLPRGGSDLRWGPPQVGG